MRIFRLFSYQVVFPLLNDTLNFQKQHDSLLVSLCSSTKWYLTLGVLFLEALCHQRSCHQFLRVFNKVFVTSVYFNL